MSCVIVSVCSALLVAMNHVTLYIVYIHDFYECVLRARARGMCACACVRAFVRAKSLGLLYCVYFSMCVCVCVTHNHESMCLRVHIAVIRAR